MKVRFEILNDTLSEPRLVTPYNGKENTLSWEKDELPRYDFKKKIKDLTFLKSDFKYFLDLEQSENNCDLQELKIIISCGESSLDYMIFKGTFTMSSGDWDLDKCIVKFKIDELDVYECIDNNDDDVNIFDFNLTSQIAILNLQFGVETYVCYENGSVEPNCADLIPSPGYWTLIKKKTVITGATTVALARLYARNYLYCDCDYVPSSEWVIAEECVDGQKKYVKYIEGDPLEVADIDVRGEVTIFSVNDIDVIDNGLKLQDVMQNLLNTSCGVNYNIVSDFFQWNPENVSTTNYVTQSLNKFRNLLIFQKSDVKRPYTSNNATKAETNFIEILEQICGIFNCAYNIKNNTLRIEHISWFETDLGLNILTSNNLKNHLKGTRKYSYDETKLPKYEKFKFMESGSPDFIGLDIEYDSNCVNNDKENKSTVTIDKITTDVMYCLQNPSANSDKVSDDGFVIMACDQNNNVYFEPGILEINTSINNVLSWANLHDKLFRHGRVLKQGILNGNTVIFESILPTIKQDKFKVQFPCNYIKAFDPLDKIRGTLGYGYVQTAELNLDQCTMSLELLLEEIDLSVYEGIFGDFDNNFNDDFD